MFEAYPDNEECPKFAIEMLHSTVHTLRFPESFSRTYPVHDADLKHDTGLGINGEDETEPHTFPILDEVSWEQDNKPSSLRGPPRSHAMRLENILNDVSIGQNCLSPRSRSLCSSPTQCTALFDADIFNISVAQARSVSSVENFVKKKKVKMHKCPECQKEFPRPSGLKTHMNMHTKEKPFACTYPGCTRTFSVVSNAKRHMRTHGVGISADEQPLDPNGPSYVVGFEAPVIISPPEVDAREPLKLRWISPTSANQESRSGSSSADSSRSRSISRSGARDAGDIDSDPGIADEMDERTWHTQGLYSFPTAIDAWDKPRREGLMGPASPTDVHLPRGFRSPQTHRRVESEGSTRLPALNSVR